MLSPRHWLENFIAYSFTCGLLCNPLRIIQDRCVDDASYFGCGLSRQIKIARWRCGWCIDSWTHKHLPSLLGFLRAGKFKGCTTKPTNSFLMRFHVSLPDSNNILTFPWKYFKTKLNLEPREPVTELQVSLHLHRTQNKCHGCGACGIHLIFCLAKEMLWMVKSDINLTKKLMPTLACFWRQAALVWHLRCYSKRLAVFFMLHPG